MTFEIEHKSIDYDVIKHRIESDSQPRASFTL